MDKGHTGEPDWILTFPLMVPMAIGHGDSINIKVSSSERILALDAHDHLLGLAADQLLVQPHKQGQGVVDGAEGDGCDWGAVGGEVEDVLVGVGVLP